MSDFRRRLMSSINTLDNCELVTEMFTNTDATSVNIPKGAIAMDIFLVGGGGGGGAWYTWGCTAGSPGLGGECFCKRRIPLQGVSSIEIKCGSGGNCATSRTNLIRSATDGGVTTLTTNVETYSAKGGIGGYNGMNQSGVTVYTYPDGNVSYVPIFINKCTAQLGYDTRVMTEYGYEGAYMRGLDVLDCSYWATVQDVYQDDESIEVETQFHSTTYPNYVEVFRYGVPAFYEEGNCTFAAQGPITWRIRNSTTFGTQGSAVYNSSDGEAIYNACGYGGGGFGGRYRNSNTYYGGNGTQGIVIIRWYIKKGIKTTTIRIDQNLTDPATMITRIVDNGGIEAIRYNSHRYVGVFDSAANIMSLKQLHDYDGTRYLNGTTADITTLGNDVWMKLPQFWYKAEEYETDVWDISFAYGGKPDDTWKEWDGKDLIGVYKAYVNSSKMYSASGCRATAGYGLTTFEGHASNRGTGFRVVQWKHYCMMAFLFFCYYDTTYSNSICGTGDYWDNYNNNGLCDSLGMTDTKNADKTPINFWGLENWWGLFYEMIGGLRVNYLSWVVTEDDGTERVITTSVSQISTSYYAAAKMFIGENLDLVPISTLYSSTYNTGYCNMCYIVSGSNRILLSGYHGGHMLAGVVNTHASYTTTQSASSVGTRLTYRGDYIITD